MRYLSDLSNKNVNQVLKWATTPWITLWCFTKVLLHSQPVISQVGGHTLAKGPAWAFLFTRLQPSGPAMLAGASKHPATESEADQVTHTVICWQPPQNHHLSNIACMPIYWGGVSTWHAQSLSYFDQMLTSIYGIWGAPPQDPGASKNPARWQMTKKLTMYMSGQWYFCSPCCVCLYFLTPPKQVCFCLRRNQCWKDLTLTLQSCCPLHSFHVLCSGCLLEFARESEHFRAGLHLLAKTLPFPRLHGIEMAW